jgi:hypothetical protein
VMALGRCSLVAGVGPPGHSNVVAVLPNMRLELAAPFFMEALGLCTRKQRAAARRIPLARRS